MVKYVYSHSKLRKPFFLVKFSKSRGLAPPSDAHGGVHNDNEIYVPNSANTVTDDRKYTFVANSYTAALEKDFQIDANGARAFMRHFLCGVETVKRFVNVHLHCNVSNLKIISNMMTLPLPLEKFLWTPMAIFTLTASSEV